MNGSRRTFLSTVGSVSVGGTVLLAGCAGSDSGGNANGRTTDVSSGAESADSTATTETTSTEIQTVSTATIRDGTEQETTIYEIRSESPGPTAFVEGGIHGNEESGYWAADAIRKWDIDPERSSSSRKRTFAACATNVGSGRREWT
ncbi:hypothetical protein [Haladaptatus sp. W1]|uniref:hypothetical protein n=1 Tax=Haladaptatus sp. W1 TaxID=1897478 RepID=UPI000A9DD4E6|nr:hypothetical protein [Haladaptatus sp. W1]